MDNTLRQTIQSFIAAKNGSSEEVPDEWVYSTCGYCAVGCGLYIGVKDGQAVTVQGNPHYPVNQGNLCIKGLYEWKVLHHPQRAQAPMVRQDGKLVAASWEDALGLMVQKLSEALASGPSAVGIYHTGQFLLEEYYALSKLAKGVLGTPNLDSNTRLCMSAAVHGYIRSFGTDGPPGCYADLDLADLIFVFGSNPAEMHPQLWRRIMYYRSKNGTKLIVADPRSTLAAEVADMHLALRPGTNVALLNSLAYVLLEENLIDPAFIETNTTGYEEMLGVVHNYPPEKAAEITGLSVEAIREAALLFGRSQSVVTLFCQGVNQSMAAADTVTLINNLHLLTGKIGKPGSAPLSLTGQASAMSNREVGGSGFLPGFRNPANPMHRQEIADFWGVPAERIPSQPRDIMQMLDMIETGELKFLWVMGTNPAVSLPNQRRVRKLLDKVFLVVQDVYYPMETAVYADVFLPAAQWGEKTGTYTNSERRVSVGYKAVEPPGEARPDFEIFQDVARRLGAGEMFAWPSTEEAFAEWQRLSKGRPNDMSGMTYRRLEREGGLQWPCSSPDAPGTPRLYTDGKFNTAAETAQAYGQFNNESGCAQLWGVQYQIPPEIPDAEYPFWLNTGRIIEHYHTRTKTKRIPELDVLAGEGFVEMNPADAEGMGITEGEKVRLTSRRGWIEVKTVIKNTVARGQLFLPFHFGDLDPGEEHLKQAANHLTLDWVDPISKQPIFKVASCRVDKIRGV